MENAIIQVSIFTGLGLFWQLIQTRMNVSPSSIQRPLITLIHQLLLPLLVFLVVSQLTLKLVYLWMSLAVMLATLGALGVAWFWLKHTKYSAKTKAALLIASAFSSAVFLGMPITSLLVGKWSMKMAFNFMLVSHLLILFTVGIYLARGFVEGNKQTTIMQKIIDMQLFKEPLLWAIIAGIVVKLLNISFPAWVINAQNVLYACLIPLMLIVAGLSLRWNHSCNKQVLGMLPVAGIQLIVLPLLMYLLLLVFPPIGQKVGKALLMDGMMPAMVFGFLICDRYQFDKGAYTMAFTLTFALSLLTIPVWYNILW